MIFFLLFTHILFFLVHWTETTKDLHVAACRRSIWSWGWSTSTSCWCVACFQRCIQTGWSWCCWFYQFFCDLCCRFHSLQKKDITSIIIYSICGQRSFWNIHFLDWKIHTKKHFNGKKRLRFKDISFLLRIVSYFLIKKIFLKKIQAKKAPFSYQFLN